MTSKEELDLWRQLANHPKFKQLCEWADEQSSVRIARILHGGDDLREEDKLRGEVLGIKLFVEYPKVIIESLEAETVSLDNEDKEI